MISLSGLLAALVVASVPSHGARPPAVLASLGYRPAQLRVLRAPARRVQTCSAQRSHAEAQAGRVERAMHPVACEQPPRSKVILTFSGGMFGNGR